MTLTLPFRTLAACALLICSLGVSPAEASTQDTAAVVAEKTLGITGIEWSQEAGTFELRVQADSPPTYTMYELFNPLRIILDVADAKLTTDAGLPAQIEQGPVSRITGQLLDDQEPFITRIEVFLAEDRGYVVDREGNDILVKFVQENQPERGAMQEEALAQTDTAPEKAPSPSHADIHRLSDISVETLPGQTRILLQADGPLSEYRKAQLPKGAGRPDRLYIDIQNVQVVGPLDHMQIGTEALSRIRMARRGSGIRVVFDSNLDELFQYQIIPREDGLLVAIEEPSPATAVLTDLMQEDGHEGGSAFFTREEERPDQIKPIAIPTAKSEAVAQKPRQKAISPAVKKSTAAKKTELQDEFGFAGYDKQKITVDFYKIDLHNVFRLIGEISNLNIVVDEAVKGSLTLALNEVPWDFALDIILNLKDLQKEERFNTIVISPKSKNFSWPKKPAANLAIKADGSVPEAITIKKRQETPKGVLDAKKLILQANEQYQAGSYDDALGLYEQAFAKWPENKQLAHRLASLSLVQLGLNAKAVHYAKAALSIDPEDRDAALQAAIALANMEKSPEAKEYFDQAINTPKPSSEALFSYASFCEEKGSFGSALTLLAKHAELYGDSLNTMVARARVYDKLGDGAAAAQEYRAILLSGFELPADLRRFIQGRLAMANS